MKIKIQDNPKFPALQKQLINKIDGTIARKQEEVKSLKAAMIMAKSGEGIKLRVCIHTFWSAEEDIEVVTDSDIPEAIKSAIEEFHRINPSRKGKISGEISIALVIEGVAAPLDQAGYYRLFQKFNTWPV